MKFAIISLYFIVFLLAGGLIFTMSYDPPTSAKDEIVEIAGTIRPDKSGNWNVLNNADHRPIGISGVSTTNYHIRIEHHVGANKVITVVITPDETMALEGYRVGVSAGLDFSIIQIYDKDNNPVNPKSYTNQSGNIWIYGKLMHQVEESE